MLCWFWFVVYDKIHLYVFRFVRLAGLLFSLDRWIYRCIFYFFVVRRTGTEFSFGLQSMSAVSSINKCSTFLNTSSVFVSHSDQFVWFILCICTFIGICVSTIYKQISMVLIRFVAGRKTSTSDLKSWPNFVWINYLTFFPSILSWFCFFFSGFRDLASLLY